MAKPEFLHKILSHMEERPDGNAFFIAGTMYSYGQFASLTAFIQELINKGNSRQNHVGVYLADDIHTYASIFALWMSGRAFIPINPLFPVARNLRIMEQLDLGSIMHSKELPDELKIPGCLAIHTGGQEPAHGPVPKINSFSPGRDAYILFTSGSTGNPKGVRITFDNLDAFVADFIGYPAYSFSRDDRFLQIYDLSFDASVHCYTVPLTCGASVYTVPPEGIKYLAAYKLMHEHRLTFAKMPPSTLSFLRPHFPSIQLADLKYCLLGGEAFPADLANDFEPCVPNALIQNVYGPTEVTINCLIYDWNTPGSSRKQLNGIGAIGKGFGSNRVMIENDELLVAGAQVSPGYWNNPVLDREAFIHMEINGIKHRFYKTGDMVTMDADGDILFIGRNDEQVQVRGYRVELGEIESVAREFLGGINVLASGREEGTGEMKIYLAVEMAEADKEALAIHLKENLPPYMIPAQIVIMEHFPRLVSGKLDRKAIGNLLNR